MSEAWRGDDLGQVAVEEQSLELQSCATKLWTIREVLLRRHMKVAFFGRYQPTVTNLLTQLPSGHVTAGSGSRDNQWLEMGEINNQSHW